MTVEKNQKEETYLISSINHHFWFDMVRYLGPPVDMWAMGVLLYYMLMGFLPFRGRTVGQLRKLILETSASGIFPVPPRVSEGAAELIRKLLSRNPRNRPRAAKLIEEAKKASAPTRPLSMDRLVAVGTASSRCRSEPWLAHQVFPSPYPKVSAADSVAVSAQNTTLHKQSRSPW